GAGDGTILSGGSAVAGLVELTSRPFTRPEGINSCNSSSPFSAIISVDNEVAPVTLPLGLFRLVTRPSWTGSPPVSKTIGMVKVAAFAASAAGVVVAAITVT